MIYPIVAYGMPVLRKKARNITAEDNIDLPKLVEDMFETMYGAGGVGLAGPQIGKDLRIFVVDGEPMDEENLKGFKKAFINAEITQEDGDPFSFEEGCLSIPGIQGNVTRLERIRIKYEDENGNAFDEVYDGIAARIIQHEYDHIEGILFTDYLTPVKKSLIRNKLKKIQNGQVKLKYPMRFVKK